MSSATLRSPNVRGAWSPNGARDEIPLSGSLMSRKVKQMELTKEQTESLAKFALDILNEFPEMGDFDGGDIQDIAITRNLLVPQIVHAPCAEEDCNCAQFYDDADFTAGVTCYHIADWLDRVAEQRDAPVHAEQKCPFCKGDGYWHTAENETKWCDMCAGTGISKRSAGG